MVQRVKLSFFVFLISFFVFPAILLEAREGFTEEVADIQVNHGINGYFRADSIMLVNFKFKNIKKDFHGKIELRYFSDNEASCSIEKDLILTKGEDDVELCFYPYLNSAAPKFLMLISDSSGKKLWEKESNIELFETDTDSDIVIGELNRSGAHFPFKGESVFTVKRIGLKPEDLPLDFLGLSPFDIIIIPDDYLKGKDRRSIKILEDRIRAGGVVVEEKNLETIDLYKSILIKEDRDDWMWRVEKTISSILKDLTVKGGKYIFVLTIYILLVSPISYLYLKKKKRRYLYVLVIPVMSILFTIIMYSVGRDSRISGLRIDYVSLLDLRMNHSYENTIFAVTNSTNRSYDVTVQNGYKVEPAFGLYSASGRAEDLAGKMKRKVVESKGKTEITIGEGTAFETVFFKAEGNPDLHFGDMGKVSRSEKGLTGEFRNKLGVDLDHVFAIFDNEIIHLGDVKKDSVKLISERDRSHLADMTSALGDSIFMKEIFSDRENYRELSEEMLMSMLIGKLSYKRYERPVFLAVSTNRLRNEFATRISAGEGYSIFLLSGGTDTVLKDNSFLNSLNKLEYLIEDEGDAFLYNTFQNRHSTVVTYHLPRENYKKLSYLRRYNPLVSPFTISLKNVKTGKFTEVFPPDVNYLEEIKAYARNQEITTGDVRDVTDLSFEELSDYIDDGRLTVRYDIEPLVHDNLSNYFKPLIPKLSLE